MILKRCVGLKSAKVGQFQTQAELKRSVIFLPAKESSKSRACDLRFFTAISREIAKLCRQVRR